MLGFLFFISKPLRNGFRAPIGNAQASPRPVVLEQHEPGMSNSRFVVSYLKKINPHVAKKCLETDSALSGCQGKAYGYLSPVFIFLHFLNSLPVGTRINRLIYIILKLTQYLMHNM